MSEVTMQTAQAVLSEAEIVKTHDSRIKAFSRKFPYGDRDDVIQIGREALIRASRDWSKRSQFWTFASRAVFGAMIDYAKKRRVESLEVLVEDINQETSNGVNGVSNGNGGPDGETVIDLLPALDPHEREVIVLSLEGFGVEEIASKVGLKKSRVSEIYHSAAKKMRARLLDEGTP